jgi:hypothetical protein
MLAAVVDEQIGGGISHQDLDTDAQMRLLLKEWAESEHRALKAEWELQREQSGIRNAKTAAEAVDFIPPWIEQDDRSSSSRVYWDGNTLKMDV